MYAAHAITVTQSPDGKGRVIVISWSTQSSPTIIIFSNEISQNSSILRESEHALLTGLVIGSSADIHRSV